MADNKIYCAIGEEANRGTAESTTVGFIPLLNSGIPKAAMTKGIIGTLLKHFFGKATSAQNATTGQYRHILYPVLTPLPQKEKAR